MDSFDRLISWIAKYANYVGLAVVFGVMVLCTGDVVGRYLRHPIPGTLELTELSLAVVVFLGMAWTMAAGRHVSIDLLVRRMGPRARFIVDIFNYLLTLGIWSIITWQTYLMSLRNGQAITDVLKIPILPITILASFGGLLMCLVVVNNLTKRIREFGRVQ